jgi:hypothetical protein
MPVLWQCPRCRSALRGTGATENCPRCGEVVVAVARRRCVRCGCDVSASRRFVDQRGEYYCLTCWSDLYRQAGHGDEYKCTRCSDWFAIEDMYQEAGQYVCGPCRVGRDLDSDALLVGAADERVKSPLPELTSGHLINGRTVMIWAASIALALIAAVTVWVILNSMGHHG